MIKNVFFVVILNILIQQKIHSERITKKDEELVNTLDYNGIELPVSKKNNEIETINVFY